MENYIDLVVCEHTQNGRKFLFRAPRWSYLASGTHVTVETKRGVQPAVVLKSITCEPKSEVYEMMVELLDAKEPLKRIISKFEETKFEYPGESEDGE